MCVACNGGKGKGKREMRGKAQRDNLFFVVVQHHQLDLQSRMLVAYVLINVIGLLAPHAAVRTLKSRRAVALVLEMALHVVSVSVILLTSRTTVLPNRREDVREACNSLKPDSF